MAEEIEKPGTTKEIKKVDADNFEIITNAPFPRTALINNRDKLVQQRDNINLKIAEFNELLSK